MSNSGVSLSVCDDGSGFDASRADGQGGFGLKSMKERVVLMGGELSIASAPGKGTRVEARVPLSNNGAALQ